MAKQLKSIQKYTFSQLVQAVQELKKVTEQLNDNSKNLELRMMILEGKTPALAASEGSIGYSDEELDNPRLVTIPAAKSPLLPQPELAMSTSERAIHKEAEKIAEIQKTKERGKQQLDERVRFRKPSTPANKNTNDKSKVKRQKVKGNIKSVPASNEKIKTNYESKEHYAESLSSSLSSSSSSIEDLLNVQKDLLHIETDETWDMPVIQSVKSLKQEAPLVTPEPQEPEVSLQRVKVEPKVINAVRRIEEEIPAEVLAQENVRTSTGPEVPLDLATSKEMKVPSEKPKDIPEKKQLKKKKQQPPPKKPAVNRKVVLKEDTNETRKTKRTRQPSIAESIISSRKRKRRRKIPLKFQQFEME